MSDELMADLIVVCGDLDIELAPEGVFVVERTAGAWARVYRWDGESALWVAL